MKKCLFLFTLTAAIVLSSCNKNDGVALTRAIVTVYGVGDAKPTLALDDNTVLVPENMDKNPFCDGCRALTIYQDKGKTEPNSADKEYRKVKLYRIDSVLTKALAPDLGEVQNDLVYGTDPIDLYRSWLTVCEDGYVTLHFIARWGSPGTVHTINLVKDTDSEDPFHLQLRHNANGDDIISSFYYRDGIAAFNIKELLAKEKKSTYDITLTYQGHYCAKEVVFHYTPGSTAILGTSDNDAESNAAMSNDTYYK